MSAGNGMFAVVYGPASVPEGKTAAEYEAAESERREKVVAGEPGCMLYQLVKNEKSGEYFVMELYRDQESLDAHFKGMGMKRGAIPLDRIKYDTSPLKIYPVVGGYLHEAPTAGIANLISLPTAPGKGPAFEAAVTPALSTYDADEADTAAYMLVKRPDESEYVFIELFKDQASIDYHSNSAAFKTMRKALGAAKANSKEKKPKFITGMTVCGSTTRKTVPNMLAPKASL
eukprot:COSAG05_NODE_191_length_14617_cov_90.240736_6_plen_230_part_00